jgi:hypothetical protein
VQSLITLLEYMVSEAGPDLAAAFSP